MQVPSCNMSVRMSITGPARACLHMCHGTDVHIQVLLEHVVHAMDKDMDATATALLVSDKINGILDTLKAADKHATVGSHETANEVIGVAVESEHMVRALEMKLTAAQSRAKRMEAATKELRCEADSSKVHAEKEHSAASNLEKQLHSEMLRNEQLTAAHAREQQELSGESRLLRKRIEQLEKERDMLMMQKQQSDETIGTQESRIAADESKLASLERIVESKATHVAHLSQSLQNTNAEVLFSANP